MDRSKVVLENGNLTKTIWHNLLNWALQPVRLPFFISKIATLVGYFSNNFSINYMKELSIVEKITSDFSQGVSISVILFIIGAAFIFSSPLIGLFLLVSAFFIYSKTLSKWGRIEKMTSSVWSGVKTAAVLLVVGMVPGIILELIFKPLALGYFFFVIAAVYIFSKSITRRWKK
ncbi:MAG: hypothetical protein US57_C0002G0036 [Candidatus Moranbacteria bacterium GW2011_GWC2_37_73]|nr:MAG: hypothetical protein UR95_C0002G0134 [Parcubacteria group bacterium GW2011_GWC1_36_108]KKQ01023.1 MAG: hypothetical protein US09_C0003G0023 [Candidatus Moranbacteria bacterium GW2011_GWD1_36_198]KKQ02425.1 MAG: hypothetical protein US10_C0001G0023 [Candidatus Moranbacteria bacterium GW2011_GWD2_36_198]KKQ40329.1 MAG: hypothetical protein US57_C0002G0036 [Candidatus Moranbacteria bacterium GW2011_GWC2_37_73]